MEEKIKELLDSEICSELEAFKVIEMGSETYKVSVDGINKLLEKRIELEKMENDVTIKEKEHQLNSKKIENDIKDKHNVMRFERQKYDKDYELNRNKIENDIEDRRLTREFENKKELVTLSNDKKDRIIKNSIAIATIVIPSLITIWGTFKTLKFEETGSVTTIMGRGFVNKLIPKK